MLVEVSGGVEHQYIRWEACWGKEIFFSANGISGIFLYYVT